MPTRLPGSPPPNSSGILKPVTLEIPVRYKFANVGISRDNGSMENPFLSAGAYTGAYVDVRPGYPDVLVENAVPVGASVADVGAGTGKLTASLMERAGETWAVEPAGDMREAFRTALPDFPAERLLPTTAESTGLPSASLDVVTYGQCWHWLDSDAASAEAARILRADGRIAIFFNQMDVSIPWVKRLTRIMRSGDVHRFDRAPELSSAFTKPALSVHEWLDPLYPQQVFKLGTTRASWIRSTPDNRAKMRENLRWYLYEHLGFTDDSPIQIPYHTYLWTAELR